MSLAMDKIAEFAARYGDQVIEFACHAAFPLTLTTELCYCLREEFDPTPDNWWFAPELLLSGLCEQVRFDLYAMDPDVRLELLAELVDTHGEQRLNDLAKYMEKYLKEAVDRNFQMPVINSEPELVKYFALCLLRPTSSLTTNIKRKLSQMLYRVKDDPRRQFELARSVENQIDFLAKHQFELIYLNELRSIHQSITNNTLKEDPIETGDELYEFEFETLTVNDRGKVINRRNLIAQAFKEPIANDLEMVAIPSGKFIMGSSPTENGHLNDESPQREVRVPPFFIGKYPVTQSQWKAISKTPMIERILDPDPSEFKGDNLPVDKVFWDQAMEFCARLSRETHRSYRLPTEAEWEYACRAKTTTPFYFGETITGKLANYHSTLTYQKEKTVKLRNQTTPVGKFIPNAFGLYDMHGNIWEWCQDYWHSNYNGAPEDGRAWIDGNKNSERVLRGGSWDDSPSDCRSAIHSHFGNEADSIGFRVVCEMSND